MSLQPEKDPDRTREQVRSWRQDGLTVGFVPTMGALHEGHLSLVRGAVVECDRTVVSIYVNPTQFGEGEDLEEYPRRLAEDCAKLEEAGADFVFAPSDQQMYPDGYATYVVQERLTERLCGAFRPGHFRGVLTIVSKLFNIVPADRAYFGRKDFQQSVVIRQMVKDLNFPIRIRALPTVREEDGLAVSSRNEYLTDSERAQATCLYRALCEARRLYEGGETDADALVDAMDRIIGDEPDTDVEYIEIVDPETLEPVEQASDRAVAALAVNLGEARLIDNMPLAEE